MPIFKVGNSFFNFAVLLSRGRELTDAMSLHYAARILPNLLGRPSLQYAEINTSKCASVIQEVVR